MKNKASVYSVDGTLSERSSSVLYNKSQDELTAYQTDVQNKEKPPLQNIKVGLETLEVNTPKLTLDVQGGESISPTRSKLRKSTIENATRLIKNPKVNVPPSVGRSGAPIRVRKNLVSSQSKSPVQRYANKAKAVEEDTSDALPYQQKNSSKVSLSL